MSAAQNLPLRCWAEIDLAALERNLNQIKNALPSGIRYIAVVKADAYGHGIHQTVARLMHAGVDLFAVANIGEAAAIREIGSGWPIIVLSSILEDEEPYIFEYDLMPTISTVDEAQRFNRKAAERNRKLGAHIKIDSGMGRLGIWHEYASGLFACLRECSHIEIKGVFTHFASAGIDPEYTDSQRKIFMDVLQREGFTSESGALIHADNSAGVDSFSKGSLYNAVRIGLLQFGVSPYPDSLFGSVSISPVFSFKSRIGIIKTLPAGAYVSYGRTRRLDRESLVAVFCAGYGDGLPLELSNKAEVLISGKRCPVLGRVTMDQTVVDVTDLPEEPKPGDEACMIGHQKNEEITLEEFSDWANTIPWEALCSITKRVTRVYKTSMLTR